MTTILPWLLTEAWPYIATLLAALAGLFAIWRHGSKKYDQGAKDERHQQQTDALAGAQVRNQVDAHVNRLPDGGALDELRRDWSRD